MGQNQCEPENYDATSVSVERVGPGQYRLKAFHHHERASTWCPNDELYDELDWAEVLDTVLVVLDGRRPGMHPAGWEQERLF